MIWHFKSKVSPTPQPLRLTVGLLRLGRIRRMESLNDAFNLKCVWSMLKSQDRFHRSPSLLCLERFNFIHGLQSYYLSFIRMHNKTSDVFRRFFLKESFTEKVPYCKRTIHNTKKIQFSAWFFHFMDVRHDFSQRRQRAKAFPSALALSVLACALRRSAATSTRPGMCPENLKSWVGDMDVTW